MISDRTLRTFLPRVVVDLAGDIIRVAIFLFLCLLIISTVGFEFESSWALLEYLHFNDFGKFFYSTQLFEQGRNMYGPSPATAIPILQHGWFQFLDMNPPHFHLLLMPLVGMSIGRAFAVWAVGNCVLGAVSVVLIARELRLGISVDGLLVAVLFASSCVATAATMVTGQVTFLLLLPMTLAWRAARHGQWRRAAVYLGLLISIKAFLAVFLPYFALKRRWDALGWCMAVAVVVFLVGIAALGLGPYRDWLGALQKVSWMWAPMNASVTGVVSRVLDGGPLFAPLLRAPKAVQPISLACSAAVACVTFYRIWRDSASSEIDRDFAALVLFSILASPLGWVYYLWLPAGPAAAILLTPARRSIRRDVLAVCAVPGLFFPLAATMLLSRFPWAGLTVSSIYGWTALLLWLAVLSAPGAAVTDETCRTLN